METTHAESRPDIRLQILVGLLAGFASFFIGPLFGLMVLLAALVVPLFVRQNKLACWLANWRATIVTAIVVWVVLLTLIAASGGSHHHVPLPFGH